MALLARIAASLGLLAAGGAGSACAGDGHSLGDQLSAAGVIPVLAYEGDAAAVTSGGKRRGLAYTGDLHMQLTLDGDQLAGMPGFSAYLDALWINGGQPSKLAGDAQGVSGIAAPAAVRLYEGWVQYNSLNHRWSILAGRYDLNTEFYRLVSADLFVNSSFSIGPEFGLSGIAGPSVFPDTSLGVRLAYQPSLRTALRAAILGGTPLDSRDGSVDPFSPRGGTLLVAEAVWLTPSSGSDAASGHPIQFSRNGPPLSYEDKIAVGAWYYTANFNDPRPMTPGGVPVRHHGEGGAYLLLDRVVWQLADDPARRLTGFLQLGIAAQAVDRFGSYIGAGLVMSGLLAGRPNDEFGLAVAMARNASSYIDAQQQAGISVVGAETAVELSYLATLGSSVGLQPDVQYVIHPNTEPRLHNATVVQLRFGITF